MTQQPDIKTLNDGSIDYAHYITKSHAIRSADAHRALAAIWRVMKAGWAATKSLFVRRHTPAPSQPSRHPLDRSFKRAPKFRSADGKRRTIEKPKAASTARYI